MLAGLVLASLAGATPVFGQTAATGTQAIDGSALRRTSVPPDPYAPLGLRAGRYVLYRTLDTSVGYKTESGGSSAAFATVAPELRIESDWSRHAGSLALSGSFRRTFDGTTADAVAAGADADLRLDLRDSWTADLGANYDYSQQANDDPDTPSGLDGRAGIHGFGTDAALTGSAGRLRATLAGSVRRTVYENGTSGGAIVDQSHRTNTIGTARLRLGYRTGAAVTLFVEGEVSRRIYDRTTDTNGLRRSGTGYAARAGVEIGRVPVLTGEVSAGYATEELDDPALAGLAALTVDGSLVWAPTRLTTVSAFASTSLDPTTDASSSGSVTHAGGVTLAFAWRPNVTLEGSAGLSRRAFQGTGRTDLTTTAGVEAIWKVNRKAQVSAGYSHEWVESNNAGSSGQTGTAELRLRLQH